MKQITIFIALIIFLGACKKSSEVDRSLGIDFSEYHYSGVAQGTILNQNNGPLKEYIVDTAYITNVAPDLYLYMFKFETKDSLRIYFTKATVDYNYHFPIKLSENNISKVFFNNDSLILNESALSVQPRPAIKAFHTVTNLHTANFGDFNGTVDSVPLVR